MKKQVLLFVPVFLAALFFTGCGNKSRSQPQVSYTSVICAPVPAENDTDWYTSGKKAPLFDNLGNYSFSITTNNELVQRYFNQGLVLAYGFNHAEAARSFYYASQLDPDCAMAHWGYAYVLGPNYNSGMDPDNYAKAYSAIQKAVELSAATSEKEKLLIAAMGKRYTSEAPDSRVHLDEAYAEALGDVLQKFPDDPDIGTLYAESLMNLHPWDLYKEDGSPKEWTPEIVSTLEKVIKIAPQHPGVHHFYIHAVEASPSPQRGLASAKLFDDGLVPGAGHLVHMPSHIYIRTGDYHKGTLANINAIKVDSSYTTACHAQGVYPLAYYPHNIHFLAATATLEGNSEWGILASEKLADQVSIQLMQQPGWGTLQHYFSIPYFVYVKFGKWDQILDLPDRASSLPYPAAIRSYARGMAFLGKNEMEAAKAELVTVQKYAADESLKDLTIWDINSTHDLVCIAEKVLSGEILARENKFDEAIADLKTAVEIEDGLNYNEPPDWFFSVRHHLGAVQIEAGEYEDALQTYTRDLANLPHNGWALSGMKKACDELGEVQQAKEIQNELAQVFANADINISGSRIK